MLIYFLYSEDRINTYDFLHSRFLSVILKFILHFTNI